MLNIHRRSLIRVFEGMWRNINSSEILGHCNILESNTILNDLKILFYDKQLFAIIIKWRNGGYSENN